MLPYKLTFYPGQVDAHRANLDNISPDVVAPFISLLDENCSCLKRAMPGRSNRITVDWSGTPDGQASMTFYIDGKILQCGVLVIGANEDSDLQFLQNYINSLQAQLAQSLGKGVNSSSPFQKLIDQSERPLLVSVVWPVMTAEEYAHLAAGLDTIMSAAFLRKIGRAINPVIDMQYVDTQSLFQLAEEDDDMYAQCELGFRYAHSSTPNHAESFNWYKRAAIHGLIDAINEVALCYDSGTGVDLDEAQAAYWYKVGADKGESACIANLAEFYEFGRGGLPKDLRIALSYYGRARDQGLNAVEPAIERVKSQLQSI